MAKDITKELLATIKETLPETQVGLIKEALNERDELKQDVKDLESQVQEEKDSRLKLFGEFQDLDKKYIQTSSLHDLTKAENERLKAENEELKKKDVERRAELAEGKLEAVQTTQELFLKNTIVRETVQTKMPVKGTTMQTSYVNGQQVSHPAEYTTLHDVENVTQKTSEPDNREGRVL